MATLLISITAIAACAKAKLIRRESLRKIGVEIFGLSIKAESEELSREAAYCLTFIGQSDPEFIQKQILPNFPDDVLANEKYVLLLAQFIVLQGFIGYEICQKLMYMVRDHQLESMWFSSIYAALEGMAGACTGMSVALT